MKKGLIFKIILLLAMSLSVAACLNNETDLVGYGDAYIVVEIIGQDTLKGLGLHAYSYSDFSSVTVSLSGNSSVSYTLAQYLSYTQDYIYTTSPAQFTRTLPAAGNYVFNATFSGGQSLVFNNNLTSDYILPPHITLCEWATSTQRVDIKWDNVKNADDYNVKLLDTDGNILFVSPVLVNSITNYSFSSTTQGWQSTTSFPTKDQIVTVEVDAYLLESSSANNFLQCISKSRSSVTWGA